MTSAAAPVDTALQPASAEAAAGLVRVALDTPADDYFDYLADATVMPG